MKKAGHWITTKRQTRIEDPRRYYTDKLMLWIQTYAPVKKALSEFKTSIILVLYHVELGERVYSLCLRYCKKKAIFRKY